MPSGRSAPRRDVRGHDRLGGDVARAEVLGKRPGDEVAELSHAGKTAIVAVKPWRKFRPPTGPISPAAKNPPAGAPSTSATQRCVVARLVEHVRAAAVA